MDYRPVDRVVDQGWATGTMPGNWIHKPVQRCTGFSRPGVDPFRSRLLGSSSIIEELLCPSISRDSTAVASQR